MHSHGVDHPTVPRRWLLAIGGLSLLPAACSPTDLVNALIPRGGYTVVTDQAYGAGPRRMADIYIPMGPPGSGEPPMPVIVFFYGGNWRAGDKSAFRFVGQAFATRGFVVAIPDYRLYPEVQFPAFLDDCAAAVAWIRQNAVAYGGDPGRLILAGHSAGAYNAAMLALDERWLAAVGIDARHDLLATIGLAGPYDFLPFDEDTQPIFGGMDPPTTQPINFVGGREAPMFLAAGLHDTRVRPRNTTALASAIRRHGGRVDVRLYSDLGHVEIVAALATPFRFLAPVRDDMVRFIRDRI